jgi:glycosyltransferase involved in cell wall biosynthesis
MIKNKGILQLVEAAKLLHAQGLEFELHLVGDIDPGNPTSLTREELQSLERYGFLKWLGRRSDVANLLNSTSIFCLPSYYREGLPRSLVEACAAGLPIVTTDVAGCRRVVVDGKTGYLVAPRDVPALAKALACLIRSRELRERMGAAGRKRFVEEFTTTSVFSAFTECYVVLGAPLQLEV